MAQTIIATFENGAFIRDIEMELAPGTRVSMTIAPVSANDRNAEHAVTELDRLCEQFPVHSRVPHLTRDP